MPHLLVGSRNFERGEVAAKEIGSIAIPLQLDVTDRVSIATAAERIRKEFDRLDLLVNNAAISNTRKGRLSLQEYAKITLASNASLDEVRAVWETNMFGVLAVYQATLPLLRQSSDARIANVSSGVGSLTTKTNLNGYAGIESVEDGSREVVRVALLGPDGPTGTFTRWENVTIPW
jgi:NAD(P)-dependent dehydrogenase (short-subunit alcohol dehydrogenase family)